MTRNESLTQAPEIDDPTLPEHGDADTASRPRFTTSSVAVSQEETADHTTSMEMASGTLEMSGVPADATERMDAPPEFASEAAADATQSVHPPETNAPTPNSPASPASDQPRKDKDTFQPGDLVAHRYKILRFIARGGMGEVYEAQDLELGGSVALKTIRSQAASNNKAVDRFKREIQIARQVTHPNVSRIFDIEKHSADAKHTETLFLTMELLPGETVRQRIRSEGRMSPPLALPIIEQMAQGLAAAHAAGVVHRDFKSANVMLVPGPEGLRAVVTDFGLARVNSATELEDGPASSSFGHVADAFASLTGTGSMVGTPAYMAPEQVLGGNVSAPADIYALGVVIYEMITGELPFSAKSSLEAAMEKLKKKAPSPRERIPDLDPRWETVINKCLEKDPAARYQSVGEMLDALVPKPEPLVIVKSKPWSRAAAAAGLALSISLGSGLAYVTYRPERAPHWTLSQDMRARSSIAVLGFKNLGKPEDAWLSTALVEMLRSQLGAGGKARIISGENVARAMMDLKLADTSGLAKDTIQKLQANLGADLVIGGSYRKQPDGQILLNLESQETKQGETVNTASLVGNELHLFELAAQGGNTLREQLRLGEIPQEEHQAIETFKSMNVEAMRFYSEGLDHFRRFEHVEAQKNFREALRLEPNFLDAYAALANSLNYSRNPKEAQEASQKIYELSSSLPPRERTEKQALYFELNFKLEEAEKRYQALLTLEPDNLDIGLRLARAQLDVNRAESALATLKSLRDNRTGSQQEAQIANLEADAYYALGNISAAQASIQNALEAARKQQAPMLLARAQGFQSWILEDQGQHQQAIELAKEALQAFRESGDQGKVALSSVALGQFLLSTGQLQSGLQSMQQAIKIEQELEDEPNLGYCLYYAANAHAHLGDLKQAQELSNESLQLAQQYQFPEIEGLNLLLQGWIARLQGNFEQSKNSLERASARFTELKSENSIALSLWHQGELLRVQGKFEEAEKLHESALALIKKNGFNSLLSRSLLALSDLSIHQGRQEEAQKLASDAQSEARKSGALDDEARATLALAMLSLNQGNDQKVNELNEHALVLAMQSQNPTVRWKGVQLQALLAAKTSPSVEDAAKTLDRLKQSINEAQNLGFAESAAELGAALGSLEQAPEQENHNP